MYRASLPFYSECEMGWLLFSLIVDKMIADEMVVDKMAVDRIVDDINVVDETT